MVVREGQNAPDANGSSSSFPGSPTFNDSGQAAFKADLTGTSGGDADNEGIFRGNGGSVTQIARTGQSAPDANGSFLFLSNTTSLNDSGQVAFTAGLTGTIGGNIDNEGIFRGSGGSITQITREGQTAPDANGSFSSFSMSRGSVNDSGQIAFFAFLTGTSGGNTDDTGIFRGSGGSISRIARRGQIAPDTIGVFSGFANATLNDAGQVALGGFLNGTSGGVADNEGIFRGDGNVLTQIAREGQTAPDGNGSLAISGWTTPQINDSGQVEFSSTVTGTSGGTIDDQGVFTGDGIDLLQVARTPEPEKPLLAPRLPLWA